MRWTRLVLAVGGLLLLARPGVAPWAVLPALVLAFRPVLTAWRAAGGTALRPAVVWGAVALALGLATESAAVFEPVAAGRPIAGHLAYVCALATLAGLVSVLNARTPGGGAWALLTALLLVVFLIPWLEGPGLGRAGHHLSRLRLQGPWDVFFCLLVLAGVTNFLPTRYGPAACWLLLGLVLEAGGLTGWVASDERRAVVWTAFPWALAAAAEAARAPTENRRHAASRCEALWLWFRDHWGVVWGLRVMERFNRSAQSQDWPVRLAWHGLVVTGGADGVAPGAAEGVLAGLLRRFATPARLAGVVDGVEITPCQPPDGP